VKLSAWGERLMIDLSAVEMYMNLSSKWINENEINGRFLKSSRKSNPPHQKTATIKLTIFFIERQGPLFVEFFGNRWN
jgi:hypothetical protein